MGIRGGRIEVRNILSLMSLIFLFGCNSEPTLLEKCIEANFEQKVFIAEEDEFTIRMKCALNTEPDCVERRLAKAEEVFIKWAREEAKEICHSQGIY